MQTAIVWFRNDLRLHDNITLLQAIAHNQQIVPLYILDNAIARGCLHSFPKLGAYRRQFLVQCVTDLRSNLQEVGADLIVCEGDTIAVLQALCTQYNATAIYYSKEVAPEEVTLENRLTQAADQMGVAVHSYHNATLLNRENLPFSIANLPDVFTTFRQQVERVNSIPPALPPLSINVPADMQQVHIPAALPLTAQPTPLDKRAAIHFTGGETAAIARVQQYLWETDGASTYFETRNGLVGHAYSTKLSPWLATGAISARYIHAQVKQYEQERIANKSTNWIIFELLWRDFFRLTMEQYGNKFFLPGGPKGKRPATTADDDAFQQWINGTTNDDFVNANMRELMYTGFMSNRGRQVVASYLVHDLKVNWLKGAAYFESMLVDYDVHSNYGNWAYVAGVGNDPRENRYFNTQKQAATYDPNAEYRKLWLQ